MLFGGVSAKPLVEPGLPDLPYTPEQLFWISFGQNWCRKSKPDSLKYLEWSSHPFENYRVNGVVSNSPFFHQDFNCPLGSEMNPEEKCKVWGFPTGNVEDLMA